MRPLLLMDVDGPLNPFDAPWFGTNVPLPGYRFHDLVPSDGKQYRVALSQEHAEALTDLAEEFDLVWATTWRHDANRLISPILGLSEDLPVIPLIRPRGVDNKGRSWKVQQIVDWVGPGLPFVWFDDEINRKTRSWLRAADWLGPLLALRVPATRGLVREDFNEIWNFAESL